jgi:ABC-type multidrug transport system fused ATPase/permease subunit
MVMSDNDVTLARLEDQINWYDKSSNSSQQKFKLLKIAVIVAAALIPFLTAFSAVPPFIVAVLGILVTVLEGIQQLNQYQANWISYRSTCEALKHEKFLFLASAGPYSTAKNSQQLLAERIESLVSQEHAKWASGQEKSVQAKKGDEAAPASTP